MKGNLFSSAERFAEFKRCQDHPIQQLCQNYFSEEAMNALAQVLKNHCASVGFFNISNVCQYIMNFYQVNPFKDEETTNLTPDQYLHKLPFADNAICAYNQLFAPTSQTFTAITTIPKLADALYDIAIRPRNQLLKELTLSKGEITLFEQLCDTPKKEGSSHFTGERSLDFQEEVLCIPETISHALDNLDAVVIAFQKSSPLMVERMYQRLEPRS